LHNIFYGSCVLVYNFLIFLTIKKKHEGQNKKNRMSLFCDKNVWKIFKHLLRLSSHAFLDANFRYFPCWLFKSRTSKIKFKETLKGSWFKVSFSSVTLVASSWDVSFGFNKTVTLFTSNMFINGALQGILNGKQSSIKPIAIKSLVLFPISFWQAGNFASSA